MFIGYHFVGISPTQMSLGHMGTINKVSCINILNHIFIVNDFQLYFIGDINQHKNKIWTVRVTRRNLKRRLAMTFLILATFFNPFGFDAIFRLIMEWTGSYWITDLIFYCLSGLFFGLYFWLSPTSKRGLLNLKRKIIAFVK